MPKFDAEGTPVHYGKGHVYAIEIKDMITMVHLRFRSNKGGICPFYLSRWEKCMHDEVRNILAATPKEIEKDKIAYENAAKFLWPPEMITYVLNLCGDGGSCDSMPRYRTTFKKKKE